MRGWIKRLFCVESETHFLVREKRGESEVFVLSPDLSLPLSLSISALFSPPLSCSAVHCGGVQLLRSLETEGGWRRGGERRRKGAC